MTDCYEDIITYNINKLYKSMINNEINVIKCYSHAEKKYYGTVPNNHLQPNIININSGIKSCKKHIILQALLKIKKENKLINTIINVKFNKALLPNNYLYISMTQHHNNCGLNIDYNNVTDSITLKIINKCVEDVFYVNDDLKPNEILIDKNQLILPTIIITSIEKIYYWKNELYNDDYNEIKILIIVSNNQINNKINVNYYDIIIIRNDLFQSFTHTNNITYNQIIFNRIILDDIEIKKLYFIKTFSYYNCLNIIYINRQYNNITKIQSCNSLENNIICGYNNIEYFHKLIYICKFLQIKNINLFIKNVEFKKFNIGPNTLNNNTHNDININILIPILEYKQYLIYNIDNIKSIVEYYINDNITLEFLFTLLNNNEHKLCDDNIINVLYYVLINQNKKYIMLRTELISKKNQIIQSIDCEKKNKKLIKLNDGVPENKNNILYCIMTYNQYIVNVLDNIIEYNCDNNTIIYKNNKKLLYTINKILLNLNIYNDKLCHYIENYTNKLNTHVKYNKCWLCDNTINIFKNMAYTMDKHKYKCEKCDSSLLTVDIDNKLLINKYNFVIDAYINKAFKYPIYNNYIINEIALNNENLILNLINYIKNNNYYYKILIYYNNNSIQKILIKNNIYYNILSGVYEKYDNILNNLSNKTENIILLQPESTLKLSINYNYINNIIFYKCINTLNINSHKFNEINRFTDDLKQNSTIKNIYYIL